MLCSVLIPSRGRPEGLRKAIQSVYDTTDSSESVDIRIRLDDDDSIIAPHIADLKLLPRVRIFLGPRKTGYASLNTFYTDLADSSPAKWVMIMNDDAYIRGTGWVKQLQEVPLKGFLVQPAEYQWGTSVYGGDCSAFPWAPNGFWRDIGLQEIPDPADAAFHRLLINEQKWSTHYLQGIRVVHDRPTEAELAIHRRL